VCPSDDSSIDHAPIIQAQIDEASIKGGVVYLKPGVYRVIEPIRIPSGVSLIGAGVGKDPPNPDDGSVLSHEGNGWAIIIQGGLVQIQNIRIKNALGFTYTGHEGAILVNATASIIQDLRIVNVWVEKFMGGPSLHLFATDAGAILFCVFEQFTIRHGLLGLKIEETREGNAFINSNLFLRFEITGGGFDYGVLVEDVGMGGNNNVFHQLVVDISSSSYGHVVVHRGQIIVHDARFEGTDQDVRVPAIWLSESTTGCYISGLFAHGFVQDLGDNTILLTNDKYAATTRIPFNEIVDPYFSDFYPHWSAKQNGNSVSSSSIVSYDNDEIELKSGYKIMHISVPASTSIKLSPTIPENQRDAKFGTWGVHIKSTAEAVAVLSMQSSGLSMISSRVLYNTDSWEALSMRTRLSGKPILRIHLQSHTEPYDVHITMPFFSYGHNDRIHLEQPLMTNGGNLYGAITLSHVIITAAQTIDLPSNANVFYVNDNDGTVINEIWSTLSEATEITLLFMQAGTIVDANSRLNLVSRFESIAEYASLRLISIDDEWVELSRTGSASYDLGSIIDVDYDPSGVTRLVLPNSSTTSMPPIFRIKSCTQNISRINDSNRFQVGTRITILFDVSCTVLSGSYIKLSSDSSFTSQQYSVLELVALEGGIVVEVSRKF